MLLQAGGSKLEAIVIMPGIQLYPHWAKVEWSGYVAGVSLTECSDELFRGLSMVMGSASNAIASYLLLIPVLEIHSGWRKKMVLMLVSLILAWDLIGNSVFPLLGLRHWIFIGGNYCEPVEGASMLGIPLWCTYIEILLHVILYHSFLLKLLWPILKRSDLQNSK